MLTNPRKTTEDFPQQIDQHLFNHYAGKILLREEIQLDELTLQTLILHGSFTTIPSIIQKRLNYECNRCHNQKQSLFAMIPCGRCQETHTYCRKCIEMGRVLACEPLYLWNDRQPKWPSHENPCLWEGKLTEVQQRAADRIVQAIQNDEPEMLIWGVCGSGKTEMLFQGITQALQCGKRICIATPRADVVKELYPRLKEAFPEVSMQALYGGSTDKDGSAQFVIATTHQLLRYYETFDVIMIDEIDAFPYHADSSLPFATNRSKKQTSTTIYLTATPRKQQSIQIKKGKLPHVFVPLRFHGHPLPIPQLKMSFSLKKNLRKYLPPPAFIAWLKNRNNERRQLLIFVPTIQLAEQMKKTLGLLFVEKNIIETINHLQTVHSEDPDREDKVNLFREKKLSVLITTTILERGVTFPSIDVVVLDAGHVVFDEAALVQISGRAGRSADDPTGEVIFYHDGKTEAMIDAVYSIIAMNKRGGFH